MIPRYVFKKKAYYFINSCFLLAVSQDFSNLELTDCYHDESKILFILNLDIIIDLNSTKMSLGSRNSFKKIDFVRGSSIMGDLLMCWGV